MEEKQTSSFNIYKLLTIILALVLLILLGVMFRNWYITSRAQKQYEDLAAQVNRLQNHVSNNTVSPAPEEPDENSSEGTEESESNSEEDYLKEDYPEDIPQKNLDWNEIRQVNKDIYAWIYIPGTEVDYPVLQHPSDDTYYLNYNMNGTRGYPGCIYTEGINKKDFTDFNTLIYGHNMKNNSMFASLHFFKNKTFFQNSPYIYIYVGEKVLVYQIFAAYVSGNEHIMYANDFSTAGGRQLYLDKIKNNDDENALSREADVTADSHMITLSTCVWGHDENRYLIQAVLLNEDALEE